MDELKNFDISYDRKFGVEIELNSFDSRDFKRSPLSSGELPKGIDYIAHLLMEILGKQIRICSWHPTHNNEDWICKPDSSCGIEICSPAAAGVKHLSEIEKVIKVLGRDKNVKIDDRCSLHVHVEVKDCIEDCSLAAILAYWIKCEAVFLDSVPSSRKRNRYCPSIGMTDMFSHNTVVDPNKLVSLLGRNKYSTINTYHLTKGHRDTIEFRVMDKQGCVDSSVTKNWVRLVLHFVEMARGQGLPNRYAKGDPWSSLLWLDPNEVMSFLLFDRDGLSKDLTEVKSWFVERLSINTLSKLPGVWSLRGRGVARRQIDEMAEKD